MNLTKKITSYIFTFTILSFPGLVLADPSTKFTDFKSFVDWLLKSLVTPLFIFMTGFAITLFIFGIVKYTTSAADESARANGRKLMVNGVIGLFVIISFWGFVAMLRTSFGW